VAVVATLSKGYDLDYIWKQVDRGPTKLRSTDAFSGLSVFKQVSALIGAVEGCTW
jgi:hypothetical protein